MESSKQMFSVVQLLKEDTKLTHQGVRQCAARPECGFVSPYNTHENSFLFNQESVSFRRSGMGF